jgi:hypothetical protein
MGNNPNEPLFMSHVCGLCSTLCKRSKQQNSSSNVPMARNLSKHNLVSRIHKLLPPHPLIKPKEWEGRTNELKGRCFEKIRGIILSSAMPFHAYNRVPSTMNEIDWLVELGPSAKWLGATAFFASAKTRLMFCSGRTTPTSAMVVLWTGVST